MRGLMLAFCAVQPVLLNAQAFRDSAGVRVVTYSENARLPARWFVDQEPMLVIGGALGEGSAELAAVVGAVRVSTGADAVAGVERDEDDVERVVVYRLKRR